MTATVYDAGALIAAERNDRDFWADHRVRLESGWPVVPSPVVAQVSRSPRQVQLHRLLRGCEVSDLTEQLAHAAGRLLGRAGRSDVVDAVVAEAAIAQGADIVSSDRRDIQALLDTAQPTLRIIDV